MAKSYYEILQVHPDASQEVIRAAYRALSTKYHPDKDPSQEGLAHFKQVQQAFETLSDPIRQRQYDVEHEVNSWEPSRQSSSNSPDGEANPTRNDREYPSTPVSKQSVAPKPTSDPGSFRKTMWIAGVVFLIVASILGWFEKGKKSKGAYGSLTSNWQTSKGAYGSLTGNWQTSNGDTVRLTESGNTVSMKLVRSSTMASGTGVLTRTGNLLRGKLNGCFHSHPYQTVTSSFEGTIMGNSRIEYHVDFVRFIGTGSLTTRASQQFVMTRSLY